jgi:thiol:disulfide interchange protein DsbD
MGFFASQGEHRPSRTLPLAILYVLGLCLTFTLLGMAAAFAGQQIGLVLESPWGVAAICVILALLAASLFGAFEIQVPGRVLSLFQGRRGLLGAVLMGAAVGLVAAPCVGPFVAALVTFVAKLGKVSVGALLFFVLALGLGLPYLVLAMFTGLINRVPRGGGWLVWTKRVLAFPVLGLIFYFLQPHLPPAWLWSLLAALALAAAVYLGFLEGRSRRPWSCGFVVARVIAAIVFTALAVGTFTIRALPALGLAATSQSPEIPWQTFQEGNLARAQAEGTPTVLYFTASWCAYCREMKEGTFRDPEVRAAVAGVHLLQIDVTAGLPQEGEAGRLTAKYVHGGPPVLVFFDRRGHELAQRSEVNAKEFLTLLERTKLQR